MKLKILLLILVLLMGAGLAEEDVLTLPDGLTVVEAEAFMNDASLGAVVVPEGALEIGARAFANSSVTEITLPESLTFIAGDAFSGCEGVLFRVPEDSYAHRWAEEMGLNPSIILPYTYKLYADGDAALTKYLGSDARIVIPEFIDGHPVTEVGAYCFQNNETITHVTLHGKIEAVNYGSFDGCVNLEKVDMSPVLTAIGGNAFRGGQAVLHRPRRI